MGLPYLSHVADDNCHDDAVDSHSLTEDDAGGSSGGQREWRGEMRKKPTLLTESPVTFPPLA